LNGICELHTKRLSLRPFLMEDTTVLFALSREETLRRRMPDQVYDSFEEAAEVTAFLKDRALNGEWPFVLGVTIRETKELIGHVGLSQVPEGIEIGYAIAMAHQGKGYGAEAVAAFSAWAVHHFALPGIWAILMADNEPSRRVLTKSGYVFQWQREENAFGGTHTCLGYLFTREEKS
jgi:[ribosomal protein S5]-alanine N-acetyltransferase